MIKPPLDRIPPHIAALADYEALAREHLSEGAWAYFSGGAGDEWTLRENIAAYARLPLRPRVLRDLTGANTRTELFGTVLPAPILLAPVAFQKLAHPDGEFATALAAQALNVPMVVSTQASVTLEELAEQAAGPLWFQLYIQPDRDFTQALVRRAEQSGYRALVVTVDAPVNGMRNREQRAGFALPAGIDAANLRGMRGLQAGPQEALLFGTPLIDTAARWSDLEWLRGITALPVLVKGIADPADARRALEAGMDGIVVSNHGGRALDGTPAAIDLLAPVVREVAGAVPVLMDGGIRRGADVLRALALGADAVLVGRPAIFALASAGAPGVAHVLRILQGELELAMALTGCADIASVDGAVLADRP